jgi:asparagine synthase (glutamine-hydrolysing)
MCGILSVLRYNDFSCKNAKWIEDNFKKYPERGPEQSIFMKTTVGEQINYLGFHRLAINGYNNSNSMQPICKENCTLICNGEIYNWKTLAKNIGVECSSGSDCEIIIDLYKKYGIEYTAQALDGVFAFVLIDNDTKEAFICRDPLGVRPLFIWFQDLNLYTPVVIASELKLGQGITKVSPRPFPPGHYLKINLEVENVTMATYKDATILEHIVKPYYSLNVVQNPTIDNTLALPIIRNALTNAVNKRVANTDREVACLLSGGLDSSLISALVAKELAEKYNRRRNNLHTWSIGLEGSEDLEYAKIVAKFIGSTHHEIKLSEKDFLDAIPEVIRTIESNDTTTVRASVGNWLICKYIKEHSDAKVIFNGDGSDEVCGGYLYFHAAPTPVAFDKECKRLLKDIHLFDVLRSDRSISSHGLEARTPFLDKNFIQSYLSLPDTLRDHSYNGKCEKFLLRKAFESLDILPNEVLWRTKEAFSDGVSKSTRSWFEIIQEFASKKYDEPDLKMAEQLYYDDIFYETFANEKYMIEQDETIYLSKVMPYKWMPRFVDATDASARTLKIYNTVNKDTVDSTISVENKIVSSLAV